MNFKFCSNCEKR